MQTLEIALLESGFGCFQITPAMFTGAGEIQRADRNGVLNAWFWGQKLTVKGREIFKARWGDWKTDEKFDWSSIDRRDAETLPDYPEIIKELEKLAAQEKAEKQKRQAEIATKAFEAYANAVSAQSHPYMQRKKLGPEDYGQRVDASGNLLIPLRDTTGKIWSLQKINSEGQKTFLPGGKIRGCFHTLWGNINNAREIFVTEGFATGASVATALGPEYATDSAGLTQHAVVCAFNAGNLAAAASQLREANPSAKIVICADNDAFTRKPDGSAWNPGIEKAQEALRACKNNSCVVFPVFSKPEPGFTDFNDLAAQEDLEAVRISLENQPASEPEEKPKEPRAGVLYDIDPLPMRHNDKGKPVLPSESSVVKHLLDHFGNNLIKQDRDLFTYTGTHWRLLSMADHDAIKIAISRICHGMAGVKFIDNCFRLFVYSIASKPDCVDMFRTHPFCANFQDGTLYVLRDLDHKFRLEFLEHAKEDFLINVLPYNYKAAEGASNPEFQDMLQRVFEGDADKAEKIRAVSQMYGACLVSVFPHLFMLFGAPGTGKSTVLNIACRLVHSDNLCSVPPSEFQGFNMETMAGKLVNCDTDIPFDTPMRDEIVKKIIDRKPFRIRRKGIKDLDAPIPAVHLFGGNGIPRALDSTSRAHDRRWTFLEFSKVVPKNGSYKQDYWDWCFEQSPEGILNFALAGLADLASQGGIFCEPASSTAAKEDWQLSNDPVGQFLEDAREGEILDNNTQMLVVPEAKIKRAQLWEIHKAWCDSSFGKLPRYGRRQFFDIMRKKGMTEKRENGGTWYVYGFGVVAPHEALC